MRAKYFRTMFHNVAKGTIYSVGTADTEANQNWTAYYLCGGKDTEPEEFSMEERFFVCREQVRLVVAGDSSRATGKLLMDFVKENQVEQVVIPASQDEMAEKLREAGAKHVVELKPGSSLYEEKDFWQFRVQCYGTEEESFLVMYSGPIGIDWRTMDCLMNVKPLLKEMTCKAEIDMENHACCMRCGLYNDFDLCKGHNQNNGKGYAAGALLLGDVPVMKYIDDIKRDFEEINNQLRFVSMMKGLEEGKEFVVWAEKSRRELNHYFVLPSEGAELQKFAVDVLAVSGRNRLYLTTKESGLCGAGFFTPRVD